jgi:hypothetical protein
LVSVGVRLTLASFGGPQAWCCVIKSVVHLYAAL